jgi:uncharacterized protein YdcH (DUF465 family)
MPADSKELKELLLRTDEEYRQLAVKHQELDSRLKELTDKHYLSEPDQIEEVQLKKRKLQIKDRMEDILRRQSAVPASSASPTVSSAVQQS